MSFKARSNVIILGLFAVLGLSAVLTSLTHSSAWAYAGAGFLVGWAASRIASEWRNAGLASHGSGGRWEEHEHQPHA